MSDDPSIGGGDARPTLPPGAPLAPAPAVAAATSPAPAAAPSERLQVPTALRVFDQLADLVAVVGIVHLCDHGRLSGELALAGIAGVLGLQTGLRSRVPAAQGLGVVGLVLLAVLAVGQGLAPVVGVVAATVARARGVAVVCLVLLAGCASGGAAAGVAKTTAAVVSIASEVRRYLCSPTLDPYLGDPRAAPVVEAPVAVVVDAAVAE